MPDFQNVVSIDIGQKHMAICNGLDALVGGRRHLYLMSFDNGATNFEARIVSLVEGLESIYKIGFLQTAQRIIIERQLPQTINVCIQHAICTYFTTKSLHYELQDPRLKYKHLVGARQNFKVLGSQYVQSHYIEGVGSNGADIGGVVTIVQAPARTGAPVRCRWYTQRTYDMLAAPVGADKLDDISDTILMIEAVCDRDGAEVVK